VIRLKLNGVTTFARGLDEHYSVICTPPEQYGGLKVRSFSLRQNYTPVRFTKGAVTDYSSAANTADYTVKPTSAPGSLVGDEVWRGNDFIKGSAAAQYLLGLEKREHPDGVRIAMIHKIGSKLDIYYKTVWGCEGCARLLPNYITYDETTRESTLSTAKEEGIFANRCIAVAESSPNGRYLFCPEDMTVYDLDTHKQKQVYDLKDGDELGPGSLNCFGPCPDIWSWISNTELLRIIWISASVGSDEPSSAA